MSKQQVLIAGGWRDADASGWFQAENPATIQPLGDEFPVSRWHDCDAALEAAAADAALAARKPSDPANTERTKDLRKSLRDHYRGKALDKAE